jgi:vitamin B12 transporter
VKNTVVARPIGRSNLVNLSTTDKIASSLTLLAMTCFYRCGLFLFFFSIPVFSQEAIQQVTISADAISALSVGNRMSSTTIVTDEEIRAKQYKNVAEAIADIPGVSALPTGYGQTVSVFIRGQKSEQTLVLVDGIEYNDPTDPGQGADLSHLTLENVERIEVIRGAQSVLFPGVGSVIQIITKTGGKSVNHVGLEGGSYGTFKGDLHSSGATSSGLDYAFASGIFSTQGFSAADGKPEKDGAQTVTFSGRMGKKIAERTRAELIIRYIDGKSDLDLVPADTQHFTMSQQNWLGRFQVKSRFAKWEPTFGVNLRLIDRRSLDYGSSPNTRFIANGSNEKIDFINRYYFDSENLATLGFDVERQSAEMESDPGTGVQRMQKAVTRGAVFAQYDWMQNSGPYATAGIRMDYHSAFYAKLTSRVAPGWKIPEIGMTVRAGVGTGFKAPSIYQLYGEYGNAQLKPEQAKMLDIGFEQILIPEKLTLITTAFYNQLTHMVDFDIPNNRFVSIGKATTKGVETAVEYRPFSWAKVATQYTFLETRDDATGLSLFRRPRHRLSNTLTFIDQNWDLSLVHEMVGSRADVDASSFLRKQTPAFHLGHLALSYRAWEETQFTLRVDNLFDTKYQVIDGYGTAGLSAYLGVRQAL